MFDLSLPQNIPLLLSEDSVEAANAAGLSYRAPSRRRPCIGSAPERPRLSLDPVSSLPRLAIYLVPPGEAQEILYSPVASVLYVDYGRSVLSPIPLHLLETLFPAVIPELHVREPSPEFASAYAPGSACPFPLTAHTGAVLLWQEGWRLESEGNRWPVLHVSSLYRGSRPAHFSYSCAFRERLSSECFVLCKSTVSLYNPATAELQPATFYRLVLITPVRNPWTYSKLRSTLALLGRTFLFPRACSAPSLPELLLMVTPPLSVPVWTLPGSLAGYATYPGAHLLEEQVVDLPPPVEAVNLLAALSEESIQRLPEAVAHTSLTTRLTGLVAQEKIKREDLAAAEAEVVQTEAALTALREVLEVLRQQTEATTASLPEKRLVVQSLQSPLADLQAEVSKAEQALAERLARGDLPAPEAGWVTAFATRGVFLDSVTFYAPGADLITVTSQSSCPRLPNNTFISELILHTETPTKVIVDRHLCHQEDNGEWVKSDGTPASAVAVGPLRLKVNLSSPGSDPTLVLAAYSAGTVAYFTGTPPIISVRLHPHGISSDVDLRNPKTSVFAFSRHSCCLGEARGPLKESLTKKDIPWALATLLSWLENANSADAYGASWRNFPRWSTLSFPSPGAEATPSPEAAPPQAQAQVPAPEEEAVPLLVDTTGTATAGQALFATGLPPAVAPGDEEEDPGPPPLRPRAPAPPPRAPAPPPEPEPEPAVCPLWQVGQVYRYGELVFRVSTPEPCATAETHTLVSPNGDAEECEAVMGTAAIDSPTTAYVTLMTVRGMTYETISLTQFTPNPGA